MKFLNIEIEAELIWTEDDATVRQPGHESLLQAFKRLVSLSIQDTFTELTLANLSESDADFNIINCNGQNYIFIRSYPGNSSIYKVNKMKSSTRKEERSMR